jgi:signal-transduction protein with cAMP-binding, CBS, and nucleotidyltransferase domain
MKIRDVLRKKGHQVITIEPHQPVKVLVHRLTLKNIGAMVVSGDDQETICGIVSERDVIRAFSKYGIETQNILVSELMTRDVTTCVLEDNIKTVMGTMTQKRIRHIPVEEDRQLVGLVSIGDMVKSRMEEMQLEANVLRDHVIALNHPTFHP